MIGRPHLRALVALVLIACSGEGASSVNDTPSRCALCGMRVEPSSEWRAGARSEAGETLAFDAPKCLFRYRHERGAIREPWVIEYYTQERANAEAVLYVSGTDLYSPMGNDLVPVEGQAEAENLRLDHHGVAIYRYDEVTQPIVDGLFEVDE